MSTPILHPRYRSWLREQADAGTPLFPAATVVLLRDTPSGVEVLLLQRNTAVEFAGGLWVFPGGRIDRDDHPPGEDDLLTAARNACVREAHEEAGQNVDVASLTWFAHWNPPTSAKKRFATFFFVCRALGDDVTIDGSEIHDHQWIAPSAALARHREHRIELAPPTWVTLHYLSQSSSVEAAIDRFRRSEPRFYETHVYRHEDRMCFVWEPDRAYDDGQLEQPGPRHRVVVTDHGWELDDSAWPLPL